MKNQIILRSVFAVTAIFLMFALASCTKEYVVKPEDVQAYLDKGIDLTITLPAGSSFDLVHENGKLLSPGQDAEVAPTSPAAPASPADTMRNGGNGEKKFRHAGAFVQQAFAGTGAYQCPSVCSIIIRTPL